LISPSGKIRRLGGDSFAGSVADMRGKEKAKGGVLAHQESAESGVDTSANHRGAGHGSAGEQRRGSEHGCGDHRHTTLGNGNRPLDARTVRATCEK
jgi:hypothetical protein